jgi:hypothetical protein
MKRNNKKSRKWQTPGSSWFKYLKMDTPKLNRNNRTSKRNSPEIAELKNLYLEKHRERYPSLPEYARTAPSYTDRTSNGLTKCIIDWLRLNNCQCERISCTGRYIPCKVVTDILGHQRKIGRDKWIKASMQPGTADISAIISGQSIKIEIKMLGDRQSEAQKEYQRQVEAAGGTYLIVHLFSEFISYYNNIINGKI